MVAFFLLNSLYLPMEISTIIAIMGGALGVLSILASAIIFIFNSAKKVSQNDTMQAYKIEEISANFEKHLKNWESLSDKVLVLEKESLLNNAALKRIEGYLELIVRKGGGNV